MTCHAMLWRYDLQTKVRTKRIHDMQHETKRIHFKLAMCCLLLSCIIVCVSSGRILSSAYSSYLPQSSLWCQNTRASKLHLKGRSCECPLMSTARVLIWTTERLLVSWCINSYKRNKVKVQWNRHLFKLFDSVTQAQAANSVTSRRASQDTQHWHIGVTSIFCLKISLRTVEQCDRCTRNVAWCNSPTEPPGTQIQQEMAAPTLLTRRLARKHHVFVASFSPKPDRPYVERTCSGKCDAGIVYRQVPQFSKTPKQCPFQRNSTVQNLENEVHFHKPDSPCCHFLPVKHHYNCGVAINHTISMKSIDAQTTTE